MIDRIRNILRRLVYPQNAVCMGCGSQAGHESGWLCDECRENLAKSWIGASPPPGDIGAEGVAFAYHYAGPAGGIVRNMKYRGVHRLGEMMARDMVRALAAIEPIHADMVVPVPMHFRRKKLRGYNHAELLAEIVAREKGLEMCLALQRVRPTVQQARLSGSERRNNLDQAIVSAADVRGKCVLLVDDVCTSGATAVACERALREAGAKYVYLLCYALAKE